MKCDRVCSYCGSRAPRPAQGSKWKPICYDCWNDGRTAEAKYK